MPDAAGTIGRARDLLPALADGAGAIVRRYFRQPFDITDKEDASPVTTADRAAEALLRRLIGRAFPDHGIIGEEYGADRPDAEFVWILDPIDGTRSFIAGVPLFGVLVALTQGGRPILGMIDQPVLGERWIGEAGRPTLFNGAAVRTRTCPAIDRAALFTTDPELFETEERAAFDRVRRRVRLTRYSADCYAAGLVALGQADLMIEAGVQPHDIAALIPIVEGAGGRVTGWRGEPPLVGPYLRVLLSGDRTLHERVLELLGASG